MWRTDLSVQIRSRFLPLVCDHPSLTFLRRVLPSRLVSIKYTIGADSVFGSQATYTMSGLLALF